MNTELRNKPHIKLRGGLWRADGKKNALLPPAIGWCNKMNQTRVGVIGKGSRGSTVEVRCACGTLFTARVADRKRGWAKSCSKRCAAIKSNRETGKYERHLHSQSIDSERTASHWDYIDCEGPGWDAHKTGG